MALQSGRRCFGSDGIYVILMQKLDVWMRCRQTRWVVAAGVSCGSLGHLLRGKMTVPLEMGDVLLTPVCGAYTSSSVSLFNGYSRMRYVVWEDIRSTIE